VEGLNVAMTFEGKMTSTPNPECCGVVADTKASFLYSLQQKYAWRTPPLFFFFFFSLVICAHPFQPAALALCHPGLYCCEFEFNVLSEVCVFSWL
jgi:hypothetical protein